MAKAYKNEKDKATMTGESGKEYLPEEKSCKAHQKMEAKNKKDDHGQC